MRLFLPSGPLAVILALVGSSGVAARGALRSGKLITASSEDGPLPNIEGAFIVMFKDPDAARASGLTSRAQDHHATFYEHLLKRKPGGIKHKIRYSWADSKAISGVSIQLMHAADEAALHNAPGVMSVHPVQTYRAPTFQSHRASSAAVKAACKEDTFAPHIMSQVDRLYKKGYYGKGVKVAVLDTGIDYGHPALNAGLPAGTPCFGKPECQVVGGYDLVGDDYRPSKNDPVPDNDPFANCEDSEHGTHTSGTIIANDTTLGFTGVVPQAKLAMYRLFGCGNMSTTSDDVIIAGMARALVEGADVLSLSLGGESGWASSASAIVASRISRLGVPVVASAGNDGDYGAFYSESPGNSEFGLNVASVQNTVRLGFPTKVTGVPGLKEIFILTPNEFVFSSNKSMTLPLYANSSKTAVLDDACTPLPTDLKLDGKVVLVLRGTCLTKVKQRNVLDRGGKYVIVAVSKPPISLSYASPLNNEQQTVTVSHAEGIKLQAAFAAGNNITITFDSKARLQSRPNKVDGGLLSSFTNFGPTTEMLLAPNIGAPGGNILSTYPIKLGSYGIISGTSMSTPFLAGVVAQYISIHGKTPTDIIRSRLMAHSTPIIDNHNASSPIASVGCSGAGLVKAYDGIFATATAHPSQLALNDSVHFKSEHWITIKNIGKKIEKFTATHLPAGTACTANTTIPGYTSFNAFPVPFSKEEASVIVSPSAFTLSPGASKKVKVTVKPPHSDQRKLPLYSGYIKFTTTSARSTLSVPYLGLAASISKIAVLDTTSQVSKNYSLPALINHKGALFKSEPTLDLRSNTSALQLAFRMTFSSASVDVSLVEANITFTPSIKHKDFAARGAHTSETRLVHRRMHQSSHLEQRSHLAERAHVVRPAKHMPAAVNGTSHAGQALFSDVVAVGIIDSEPYYPRGNELVSSIYKFAISEELLKPNGSAFNVTEGRYRVLLRAQHPFTDGKLASSYESWLSEPSTYRKDANATKA